VKEGIGQERKRNERNGTGFENASRYLAVEQLAISPQCGFGGPDHLVIPEVDQWAKFEPLIEVAKAVWGFVGRLTI
jgi:hypothetical protein